VKDLLLLREKSTNPPSNYHQIDNVPPKLSIVTMSPPNYQNIVNDPSMTKLPSIKKNTKTSRKKHKSKKKKKKIQRVEN
jgi:hypothetical protein